MWRDFFREGGNGMYPVTLWAVLLVAAAVLYAMRPDPRRARLVQLLGVITFASGLLGTSVGLGTATLYTQTVTDKADQLQILALGISEALHCTVLALIVVVTASFISLVGLLRAPANPKQSLIAAASSGD